MASRKVKRRRSRRRAIAAITAHLKRQPKRDGIRYVGRVHDETMFEVDDGRMMELMAETAFYAAMMKWSTVDMFMSHSSLYIVAVQRLRGEL